MIRYYGFLANRVRGKLLPLVYQLIQQTNLAIHSLTFSYAKLIQREFKFDPFTCILCGYPLRLTRVVLGMTSLSSLMTYHRELA